MTVIEQRGPLSKRFAARPALLGSLVAVAFAALVGLVLIASIGVSLPRWVLGI